MMSGGILDQEPEGGAAMMLAEIDAALNPTLAPGGAPRGRLDAIVGSLNSGEFDAYDAAILPLRLAREHWPDKAGLRRFCEAVIEAHRQAMDEC